MEVRSLSKVEARVVLSLEADGLDLVSLDELRRRGKISEGFARKTAHTLVRKGWLQPVGRGVYLLNPSGRGPDALPDADPLRVGSHLVAPYYFGFGTAAQLTGLLSRAGPVYYIVSPTRTSFRPPGAAQFRLVHVRSSHFFGGRIVRRRGQQLSVSDAERTVIDCLSRPELAGGVAGAVEVLAHAKPNLRWRQMTSYLAKLGRRSLALRLGYLAELVRPEVPVPKEWVERTRARPDEPYVPLAPPSQFGRRGHHDVRWHVVENIPRAQLLGELRHL